MSKPRLVRFAWTDLNSSYLEWILRDKFDLTIFNSDETYDKNRDLLVMTRPESCNPELLKKYLDDGFKLLIVNLWEARPFVLSKDFLPYLCSFSARRSVWIYRNVDY